MKTLLKIGDKRIVVEHPDNVTLDLRGHTLTTMTPSHRSLEAQLNEELGNAGIKWGDAIAWATNKLGLEQCTKCKARQRILNEARRLGVRETIRQIRETFSGSE